jgi:hypothetical protein
MMPARVKLTTTGQQCQSINACCHPQSKQGTIYEMHVVIEKILTVFLLQGIHGDQGADVSGQVGTVEETATTTQGPIVISVTGIVPSNPQPVWFASVLRIRFSLTRIRILLVFDADPDHACHFDADPDPTFPCDADPDSSFQRKAQNLGKVFKQPHMPYILTCHLQIDSGLHCHGPALFQWGSGSRLCNMSFALFRLWIRIQFLANI